MAEYMKYLYIPNQYSQQRQRQKPVYIYPVLMAMEATKRINEGHDVYWDRVVPEADYVGLGRQSYPPYDGFKYDKVITEPEGLDFLSLPIPDRIITNAFDKRYQSYGNYKHHPATHMQVADGCWHGKCTFCVENDRGYQVRELGDVQKEIWDCFNLGFKEIFDDSGTFPTGKWMDGFCHLVLPSVKFGCNMRIGANVDFKMMKQAGFRMLLFGIESANQTTLDRIGKGIYAKDIIPTLKKASESGLEPHGAFMFGQPGESEAEELETLKLAHYLLRKGYLKTAQASVYRTKGYDGIDRGNQRKIYDAAWSFEFWFNKFRDLRTTEDWLYLLKCIKKGILRD